MLGYLLRRASWRRGDATEGSQALIEQYIAEPGIEQSEVDCVVALADLEAKR